MHTAHYEETKKMLSVAMKGRTLSSEHRKKIAEAMEGNKNSLGRKRPDLVRPLKEWCKKHGTPVTKHKFRRAVYCRKCEAEYQVARHRRDVRFKLVNTARRRAKQLLVPFGIRVEDIFVPEICPVLGIALKVHEGKGSWANSPSLDRIFPDKGYVKGNVRVISHRANTLKSDASIEELRLVLADAEASFCQLQ